MTNEEAIELIKVAQAEVEWSCPMDYAAAFDLAIKALEQQPCEDCISRQAAIEAISRVGMCKCNTNEIEAVDECLRVVKALPPVTPQPKTGHWILTDDDFVYCSECEDSYYPRPIDASWYYCPHCGAKMVEP